MTKDATPRETVFHHLPEVKHFDSAREFLACVAGMAVMSPAWNSIEDLAG